MSTPNDIVTILCPDVEPDEQGLHWARFPVSNRLIPGCRGLYYCTDINTAATILVNQIKPELNRGECFFSIFPNADNVTVDGAASTQRPSFTVTHYGRYGSYRAEAIARDNVTRLMEIFREAQQRYISSISFTSRSFDKWADDNSAIEQYVTVATVRLVTPYAIAPNC